MGNGVAGGISSTPRSRPGGTVSAVSRNPNQLDIFLVSNDGGVYTAAWNAGVANGQWQGWWKILNATALPGSPVGVVSRNPNQIDIFVAGNDGKTYTAAWNAGVANGQWQGWWNILTGAIPPGGTTVTLDSIGGTIGISAMLNIFLDELLDRNAYPSVEIRPLFCSEIEALETVTLLFHTLSLPQTLERGIKQTPIS